jgi:hypothetical protein
LIKKAILDGRVKAVSYFGHGGGLGPTFGTRDAKGWKAAIRQELLHRYRRHNKMDTAARLADRESKNFGFEFVSNHSCRSLEDNSLALLFVNPGRSYYGSPVTYKPCDPTFFFTDEKDLFLTEYVVPPGPVPLRNLLFSNFDFGEGKPFKGNKKIGGVNAELVSTNTEPYGKSSFRNERKGKTATVTFIFSEPITEFHLKVSRVQYDEFPNGFNIGNPTSLSGHLIRKKGKITVTRDKGDNGAGNLIWTGIKTTVVRFNIGGPKGTALAVDQFAILPAP